MEILIKNQLITALFSVFIGIAIGVIYDIFKIFRILSGLDFSNKFQEKIEALALPVIKKIKIKKEKKLSIKDKILYFWWDLLFFIAITPIMLIFIYATSSGVVRWYIIGGAFLGYIIYYLTVSRLISVMCEYIAFIIKIIFAYAIHFLKLPFKKLMLALKRKIISFKKKVKAKKMVSEKNETRNKREVVFLSGRIK